VKKHIDAFNHRVILVGDFNLLPDTESLTIVADGMKNLIKDYEIVSTRSKLYTKHEKPVLFADYIFATSDMEIKTFKVLQNVVSDHLPLYVEI
jgi:endonuclease/exonuclease/phosphatase family metal-dependent hydrolase